MIEKTLFPFAFNLQVFAEEEEEIDEDNLEDFDDIDYELRKEDEEDEDEDSEDEEDKNSEDEDKDSEDEDEEDDNSEDKDKDKDKQPKDKKTLAIIRAKKEAKEAIRIAKELQDKLDARDAADAKIVREKEQQKEIDKLIEAGYGEDQARAMIKQSSEMEEIRQKLEKIEISNLESKYPGISNHADEILALHKKANGALSIVEIYQARFSKLSAKDIKRKTEQEMIYNQQKGSKKNMASGGDSDKKKRNVKLTPSEQRAYDILTRNTRFKGMSKEDFKKLDSASLD